MLRSRLHIKSLLTLVFCIMVSQSFATASLNFKKEEDKDKGKDKKISLKYLQRPESFFSLSDNLNTDQLRVYRPLSRISLFSSPILENPGGINVQSSVSVNAGNTVVVYPYNYKLKPKPLGFFKTPSAR